MNENASLSLRCPVCMNNLKAPTFQCQNGHLICKLCLNHILQRPEKERKCPSCRIPYDKSIIRNLVADSLTGFENNTLISSKKRLSVEVVEIRGVKQSGVSGRPQKIFGIIEKLDGNKNVEPFPIGVYKINIDETIVTKKQRSGSSVVQLLYSGKYVEVVEVAHVSDEACIRGMLSNGGWVTIVDTENGCRWADPMHIGVYMTIAQELPVSESFSKRSELKKILKAESCIDITEIVHVSDEKCIRGLLSTGGWVTIVDIANGNNVITAELMPLGSYKTVIEDVVVTESNWYDGEMKEVLDIDAYLDIVEIRNIPDIKRVVGRLATGGWINLVDTSDGFKWVEPLLCF